MLLNNVVEGSDTCGKKSAAFCRGWLDYRILEKEQEQRSKLIDFSAFSNAINNFFIDYYSSSAFNSVRLIRVYKKKG